MGYNQNQNVYELLRETVGENEEIRFISFLQDNLPGYLFIIIYDKEKNQTYLNVNQVKKNNELLLDAQLQEDNDGFFDEQEINKVLTKDIYGAIEYDNRKVNEKIVNGMHQGLFKAKRYRPIDNYEL